MVKRYYDTSIRYLLGKGALFSIIFLVGIIMGSIYAIYVRENSMLFFTINQYLTLDYTVSSKIEVIKDSLMIYGKNMIMIWAGGVISITLPVSCLVFLGICFSYGFTTSCFILIYGMKGMIISLLAFGLQAIIIIFLGLLVGDWGIRYSIYRQIDGIKEYAKILVVIGMGVLSAAIIDAYVQPIMQKIILVLL